MGVAACSIPVLLCLMQCFRRKSEQLAAVYYFFLFIFIYFSQKSCQPAMKAVKLGAEMG